MRKSMLGIWFKDQRAKEQPVTTRDLTGKTVIVTGANTGIGAEVCIHLARMNPARLIMASRSVQRGEEAKKRVVAETGYRAAQVWALDLGDFASVKAFADRFSQLEDTRLDILVENAATATIKYETTKDNWETGLQVNDLSPAYHTLRLLPFMLRTAKVYSVSPRIVVVSSQMHYFAKEIDKRTLESPNLLERLSSKEYCNTSAMFDRYNLSKLINLFFVRSLAARLEGTKVVVDAADPGLCKSELGRDAPWIFRQLFGVLKAMFAHTSEEGSRRLVYCAVAGGDELQGRYLVNYTPVEESDYVLSSDGKNLQERFWQETLQVLQEFDPKVKESFDKQV